MLVLFFVLGMVIIWPGSYLFIKQKNVSFKARLKVVAASVLVTMAVGGAFITVAVYFPRWFV